MIDVNETLSNKIDDVLRPLGITRSFRSYRALRECIIRICEQEDRLEAVQKEIYEPIAETQHCKWKAPFRALSAGPRSWRGRSTRTRFA